MDALTTNACRFLQGVPAHAVCLIGRDPNHDCLGCRLHRPDRRAARAVWSDERRLEELRKLARGARPD